MEEIVKDNEIYFTPERCEAIIEKIHTNKTAFITWHILGKACEEIIRLNETDVSLREEIARLRDENAELNKRIEDLGWLYAKHA